MRAFLLLEDGSVFEGISAGAKGTVGGEIVFNTSMSGYQEMITDPSNYRQIVLMTYPLIGNYGINDQDNESNAAHIGGLIVRELCKQPSNWRMTQSLECYLKENNIVAIEGVDTRELTKIIRQKGTLYGVITTEENLDYNAFRATTDHNINNNCVKEVTCKTAYTVCTKNNKFNVALIDLGTKLGMIKTLSSFGCDITVFPAYTSPGSILSGGFDGVVLSGGPGNPKEYDEITQNIMVLQKEQIPIFGISLGHQLLALANGLDTEKMQSPHRGVNYPVVCNDKKISHITAQNHGYVVTSKNLHKTDAIITHYNLNDNTIEGIRYNNAPAFSVQFYPGDTLHPFDTGYLFEQLIHLMEVEMHAKR
ncbi:MAG: glutamine-hydrolyzing carbamoyl-phosphate synthase small subunit [Clostridiaceae bacterium]|nr:glutamine-hydrolyzing carbamoyl-phosphate synthase small subunit [Clostridiaceae bacterium]